MPLAAFGYLTPLIAALAMSSSSILVTLSALRARLRNREAAMDVLVFMIPSP